MYGDYWGYGCGRDTGGFGAHGLLGEKKAQKVRIPTAGPSGRARVTGEQERVREESSPEARHTSLFLELQTVGTTERAPRCSPDTAEAHLKGV